MRHALIMDQNKKSLIKGSKEFKNGSLGVKPRKGKYLNCKMCRNEFYRRLAHLEGATYCSRACLLLDPKTKVLLVCSQCKKEYLQYPSAIYWAKQRGHKGNYCSPQCRQQSMVTNWDKDEHKLNKIYNSDIRGSAQFKEWRKSVFERDNYTCQRCNIRGNYLEPHHIFRFSFFPDFRFLVANGVTYCRGCHQLTKKWDKKWRLQLFDK